MITDQLVLGLVIGVLATNAALFYTYHVSRRRRAATEPAASSREGDVDVSDGGVDVTDDDAVVCLDCGTENEPGYRFCRSCVSVLPGANRRGGPGNGQAGRVSL